GAERGGPEAVPRTGESDAGVGGIERRVEAAHEEPHARSDGVGQRAGTRDPCVDPERVVVDLARRDVEARAHEHVDERVDTPRREPRPGKSSSSSTPLSSPARTTRCTGAPTPSARWTP